MYLNKTLEGTLKHPQANVARSRVTNNSDNFWSGAD